MENTQVLFDFPFFFFFAVFALFFLFAFFYIGYSAPDSDGRNEKPLYRSGDDGDLYETLLNFKKLEITL